MVPLLVFDLELKFKDYSRIHVKPIHFIDDQDIGLMELTKRYSHVMVDEMFDNYANLSKRSQEEVINMTADKSTVWIAISNMHIGIATKSSENPHSDIGRFFPKFEIAEIKTPLRSPRQNVLDLKDQLFDQNNYFPEKTPLNHKLLMQANMPPNITDGRPVQKFISDGSESLKDSLEKCFKNLPEDKFALIVIEDNFVDLQSLIPDIPIERMINCNCQKIFYALGVMHALKLLGRPTAKIHSINAPIDKEVVKRWISGDKKEDLITSHKLANGFESEFVIVIGRDSNYMSRSFTYTSHILSNYVLEILPVMDSLDYDHQCQKYLLGDEIMHLKAPVEIIGKFGSKTR